MELGMGWAMIMEGYVCDTCEMWELGASVSAGSTCGKWEPLSQEKSGYQLDRYYSGSR
jgi:hypothetical protein